MRMIKAASAVVAASAYRAAGGETRRQAPQLGRPDRTAQPVGCHVPAVCPALTFPGTAGNGRKVAADAARKQRPAEAGAGKQDACH